MILTHFIQHDKLHRWTPLWWFLKRKWISRNKKLTSGYEGTTWWPYDFNIISVLLHYPAHTYINIYTIVIVQKFFHHEKVKEKGLLCYHCIHVTLAPLDMWQATEPRRAQLSRVKLVMENQFCNMMLVKYFHIFKHWVGLSMWQPWGPACLSLPSQAQRRNTGFAHQGMLMNDWFDPSWCSFHLLLTPPLWSQVPLWWCHTMFVSQFTTWRKPGCYDFSCKGPRWVNLLGWNRNKWLCDVA